MTSTERAPSRVVIDDVQPMVGGGAQRAKSSLGELFTVTAVLFADGHDRLDATVRYRHVEDEAWHDLRMTADGNDRWHVDLVPARVGAHEYAVGARVDRFASWLHDLERRAAAGWPLDDSLDEGAQLIIETCARAPQADAVSLQGAATWLRDAEVSIERRLDVARDPALSDLLYRHRDPDEEVWSVTLGLWVDEPIARFSAWYEMFPRSVTHDPRTSGSLRDAASRFPDIAAMGFDVLYLPPVHPIGRTARKGPGNTTSTNPADPGSPWAIGDDAGGHTALHPELGTLADFDWFVQEAARHGLSVALDLAFQCSPDHPWVTEHPSWFRHRADGSVRFAENPPKQYQDIYPIDFETADWPALWRALSDIVQFWIRHGVRIFRVDNPHTKPFPFWAWLIEDIHRIDPGIVFLAEAFTTPARMQALAKLGFTQSYSYFTWRNTKAEIEEYFTELNRPPVRDYFRANLFVNTPDILHATLQRGDRATFIARAALAATLGTSWGMYSGYELLEHEPAEPGSEEYLSSEKYELRPRDWNAPGNIKTEIARLNGLRRAYRALQYSHDLWFLPIANEHIVAYVKGDPRGGGHILTVVSLDPHGVQSGWVGLPRPALGLPADAPFRVCELLSGDRLTWSGEWHGVALDPAVSPVLIFDLHPDDAPTEGASTEGAA